MAKRNISTSLGDSPLVIGLGPGFCAGRDAHFVIETNRGHRLGSVIEEGEVVAEVGGVPLKVMTSGVLRGILHDGLMAEPNMKVGDVDPRTTRETCRTISKKARATAGAVLDAVIL